MKKLIMLSFVMSFLFFSCGPKDYLKETQSEKEVRMEWWKDAKFGMFIHWGVYSVPAGWYKDKMVPGISEWIMYSANIPVEEYEKYAADFNPVEYNPEKWVRIAKQAGMKYIVITSKHHDGFCIWDSKITNYDIVDFTQYKKDLLKPLYEACKKEGIKLGFYHSIMDWHHPNAVGENFPKYRDEYLIPQLEELLSEFPDLSILWFDGEWIDEWTEEQGRNLYNHLRNISPELIINNRIGKGRQGMQGMNKDANSVGDFGTPEQEILETSSSLPWESCMTMNDSWGYKRGDENWKSSGTIIYNIIDIASKGGNYLLNVGPDSKGNIPEPSVEILEKVGKWMDKNAEGIYNARTISNYAEGENIRFTKSKDSEYLYAFIIESPENGNVSFSYVTPNENSKITLLGENKDLEYTINNKITTITLPENISQDDFPICLKFQGTENSVSEIPEIKVTGENEKDTYLFQDKIEVELVTNKNSNIYYTLDGTIPSLNSNKYSDKLSVENSCKLNAIVVSEGSLPSPVVSAQFYKIQSVKDVLLKIAPSAKYSANGKLSLVDGKRGSTNYNKEWLGFEGEDLEVTLDLGISKKINGIHLGTLSNINSWIFLPKSVSFQISNDNKKFTKVSEVNYDLNEDENQRSFIKDISASLNSNVRYIKIIAKNIKECPSWHRGAGEKAWIFFDEIIID
ncbi:MAG: alpha-L-fucosidase [Ignavibacteriales bacterium]|nr:alpha-L-fucosidase [Ignavibacteriales bacterium]